MSVEIRTGDCRALLDAMPDESVHCVVTSPPYYGLRDYGEDGQIGLEATPQEFVEIMVDVFAKVRRVLRKDGTLWLNLGDGFSHGGNGSRDPEKWPKQSRNDHRVEQSKRLSGFKPKDLLMIPARVAMALQADGWWLRSEIVWSKPNPMPESVRDRPTSAHEKVFLLSKSQRYFYDAEAVRRPCAGSQIGRVRDDVIGGKSWQERNQHSAGGRYKTDKQRGHSRRHAGFNDRWDAMSKEEQAAIAANLRNVWEIATKPFSEAHFATFPPELAERCIKAGCPVGGTVLDPFGGAGTTGLVADRLQRNAILLELNPQYADMARRRIEGDAGMFAEVAAE